MRHTGGTMLVDQKARPEPIEIIGCGNFIWPVMGNQIGENMARPGRCLETARSPATIEIEALDIGF